MEVAVYWGDWDRKATPDDFSDDLIQPIILWRVRQITGGHPLPAVTDDNNDGRLEVNRPEEILAYIQALKGVDSYGRQVARNPVLVKGSRVWFEDGSAPGGVGSIESATFGDKIGASEIFCHRPDTLDSPVFDRLILVDPFGSDGLPVYEKVRALTGLNPP
jgi:hypothetical protein